MSFWRIRAREKPGLSRHTALREFCDVASNEVRIRMRPALLQLAQTSIASTASGGQLRNFYIARELAKVMDVVHLGFADEGGRRSALHSSASIPMRLVPPPRAYSAVTLIQGAVGRVPATLLNFRSSLVKAALTLELEAAGTMLCNSRESR
jgi:hypothetical protein